MIVLLELCTVEEYAAMCGVKVTTVYYRHRERKISTIEIDGYVFVNHKISPPKKLMSHAEKKRFPRFTLPANIDKNELVLVSSYAAKRKVRGDIYYGLAMMDKIKSIVISNLVFILKQEADLVPKKHRGKSRIWGKS